jgi:anti-sigma-K factor RskA
MTGRDHERYVDDPGAYVLGALPELERQAFEAHLRGCDACAEEVARLRPAVGALPRSVTQLNAPDSLRQSLLAEVTRELAPPPAAARAPWWRRLRPFALRPSVAWVSAAFILLAGIVGGGALVAALGDDQMKMMPAQIDAARAPGASAEFMMPADKGQGGTLEVNGMPMPGSDRVYAVWARRGESVSPVSLFYVDPGGGGAAAVPLPLEGVDELMVTRESSSGSREPTEPPLLRVDLNA